MIPLATTLVTYTSYTYADGEMRDPDGEGFDTASDDALTVDKTATDVRAVIAPGGGSSGDPGDTEVVNYTLMSDVPSEFIPSYRDTVKDQNSNQEFEIITLVIDPGLPGLGLDHIIATVKTVKGANKNEAG